MKIAKPDNFPTIICLCGSTRLTSEMLIIQWEFAKKGFLVLSWHALPETYSKDPHVADIEDCRELIDEIHKRKIDLADEVFVVNIDGYIGESTRSEIEYAKKTDKPIKYLNN